MTDSPDTWPPPPSKPIERGEWDDFIEAEMADMPVNGIRRGRLILALHQKTGMRAEGCRHIVNDYYLRYRLVDPLYKPTLTSCAWLAMLGIIILILIAEIALFFYTPHNRFDADEILKIRLLLALIQMLIGILGFAKAIARMRELKAKRNQEPR